MVGESVCDGCTRNCRFRNLVIYCQIKKVNEQSNHKKMELNLVNE
jgi:hypothetical protein